MPDHLPIFNPLTVQLNVSPYDLYDQYYKVCYKNRYNLAQDI